MFVLVDVLLDVFVHVFMHVLLDVVVEVVMVMNPCNFKMSLTIDSLGFFVHSIIS